MVPPDGVVFDVGAHAGQFLKLFAAAASAGHVYAFEPGSYARTILGWVVRLHRLGNVTVLPCALGAANATLTLNLPIKASGSAGFGLSHFGAPEGRWATVAQEQVEQTSVDAVVDRFGLQRLDFIKADIEGWELQLLRGAEGALERLRPRLLLELTDAHLNRAGDTVADAFDFLEARGYGGFTASEAGRLVPVKSATEGDFWFLPPGDPLLSDPR